MAMDGSLKKKIVKCWLISRLLCIDVTCPRVMLCCSNGLSLSFFSKYLVWSVLLIKKEQPTISKRFTINLIEVFTQNLDRLRCLTCIRTQFDLSYGGHGALRTFSLPSPVQMPILYMP